MKNTLVALLMAACPILASAADGIQVMTVQDLKTLSQRGKSGELAAISYVQGVVEGAFQMDAVISKEKQIPPQFCRFYAALQSKEGAPHPAGLAMPMIAEWETQKMGMDKPAMVMVTMFLSAQYGQGCGK